MVKRARHGSLASHLDKVWGSVPCGNKNMIIRAIWEYDRSGGGGPYVC